MEGLVDINLIPGGTMPRIAHTSGKYDVGPQWLRRLLTRLRPRHSILSLTEVANPALRAVLWIAGWTVTAGRGEGPGEVAILSHRSMWKRYRQERDTQRLAPGGGVARLSSPLHCATAVFQRRRIGRFLVYSAVHLPARTEAELRAWWKQVCKKVAAGMDPATARASTKLSDQARTWVTAVEHWGEHLAVMRERYPDAEVMAVGDWNVNGHEQWVRDMIRELMAPAGPGFRFAVPAGGTLDGSPRAIDFAYTTMLAEKVSTAVAELYDHHTVSFLMRWPVRKKTP